MILYKLEPLDQFELIYLGSFKGIPLNNSILYMIFSYLIIRLLFGLVFLDLKLLPNNWQIFVEGIYNFTFNLIKQQLGHKGYPYFPLIFTVFIFILTANMLGMTLYSFTITSHATITFGLSFALFIGVVIIGVMIHKIEFLKIFVPAAPKALLPFIVMVEVISYISRPFSLAIRLFANMMSGHTLLIILANFTFLVSKKNIIIALLPFIFIIIIIGLEMMIAGLQAYVFAVLVCIYINDSLEGAH